MTDYEDLAFKPAMTWEDLCEWAVKEKNAMEFFSIMTGSKFFELRGLEFNDLGIIKIKETGSVLAKNKKPEQMKNIIDNLYGE